MIFILWSSQKVNWFGLVLLPYWELFLNVALFFWVWDVEGLGPFRAHHCPYTIRGWRTLCYLKKYTNFNTFVNPNKNGQKWLCWSRGINTFARLSAKKKKKWSFNFCLAEYKFFTIDCVFPKNTICIMIFCKFFKKGETFFYIYCHQRCGT
jgi:hypothetical protein